MTGRLCGFLSTACTTAMASHEIRVVLGMFLLGNQSSVVAVTVHKQSDLLVEARVYCV